MSRKTIIKTVNVALILGIIFLLSATGWNLMTAEADKQTKKKAQTSVKKNGSRFKKNRMSMSVCKGPDLSLLDPKCIRGPSDHPFYPGMIFISPIFKNIGKMDFIANPGQFAIVKIFVKNQSGQFKEKVSWEIARVNKGHKLKPPLKSVSTPYRCIRWGHSTPNSGECQSIVELMISIYYNPGANKDDNKNNDDCNLKDNTKILEFKYMSECPW